MVSPTLFPFIGSFIFKSVHQQPVDVADEEWADVDG